MPSQTIPASPISTRSSTGTKRVSFDCDKPITNVQRSSPPAFNSENALLPAPSTQLAYTPFSAFEDDVDETAEKQVLNNECDQQALGYKHRAHKNGVPQETQLFYLQSDSKGSLATPVRPVSAQATHSRAKRSSMALSREQRRHSSEDGLTTSVAVRSLPLSMSLSSNGQSQPEQGLTIPTKCRMVFHMRDEVSKVKSPSREEEKTGLSEKKGGCTPQQEPRQYQRPVPLKKNPSNKGVKRVSFKEPEPWRESPAVPATLATEAVESLVVLSEPSELEQVLEYDSTVIATSTTATDSTQSSIDTVIEPLVRSSSAPPRTPSKISTPSAQPRPSRPTNVHQRNMSAPSLSAFAASSANSDIPVNIQGSQPQKGSKSKSGSGPGNRFSRLWKNVAQKYSHNHGIRADHGPGSMIGREPIAVMARD
ncbi:hypothetical protein BGX27_008389 [Mortierella sp. AM989]|nr:hypothetical protein BGX27_008389 [Mortierella sp. AM989]